MTDQPQNQEASGVDKSLIAMFLKMTPEERLKANDNAVHAIWQLKHAYRKQQEHRKPGFERNH